MNNFKINLWLSVVSFKSPFCCGLWGEGSHCGERDKTQKSQHSQHSLLQIDSCSLTAQRPKIPFPKFSWAIEIPMFPQLSPAAVLTQWPCCSHFLLGVGGKPGRGWCLPSWTSLVTCSPWRRGQGRGGYSVRASPSPTASETLQQRRELPCEGSKGPWAGGWWGNPGQEEPARREEWSQPQQDARSGAGLQMCFHLIGMQGTGGRGRSHCANQTLFWKFSPMTPYPHV